MKALLLLACFGLSLVSATPTKISSERDEQWENYKKVYNKEYLTEAEELKRRGIWEVAVVEIDNHNMQYEQGEVGYEMGINEFTDQTEEEFVKTHFETMSEEQMISTRMSYHARHQNSGRRSPSSLDWRRYGIVSAVKDQGRCGSCWSFAAIGTFEGVVALRRRQQLVTYSEQNLLDCTGPMGCGRCDRGCSVNTAMDYIIKYDVNTDASYPYTGVNRTCRHNNRFNSGMKMKDYNMVYSKNDTDLIDALVTIGPLAIVTECVHGLQRYKGGVYEHAGSWQENGGSSYHAMLLVGYGVRDNRPFWLIKNSWGERWGESGYLYLSRRLNNHCAISSWAYYPVPQ